MIKAIVNTQRNKTMVNNSDGVIVNNTGNNAKFYNVNTLNDLPIEGQPKTFYYVDKESALYIYCNNDYLKINNDLLDSLNELELISNENKNNISQLIKQLEELREQDDQYKKEMSYKIEVVTGNTEDIQRNFNEYKIATSNLYNNFQRELNEVSNSFEYFDQKFDNIDSAIENAINDSQLTQDEVLVLLSQKQQLESDFKQLSKEYEDIYDYISDNKYITNSKGEKIYFKETIESELDINFNDLTLQWSTNNLDEDILNQYFQSNIVPGVNDLNEQYGVKELYEILIKLLNTFDSPRKLASVEKTIWYNVSDALNINLAELQYSFRCILDKAASFDAQDALMETIASINSSMNGLQNQIDGQITNWNGDQMPSPIYDHGKKKWFHGIDENGNEIWKLNKPDPNYPVTEWIVYNEDGTKDLTKTKEEYKKHVNDTYVDLITGKAYRWCNTNITGAECHWCKITDTATEQALALSAQTKQALDGRITTYTTKPMSYEVGDLFITDDVYGSFKKGEILNCITSSTDGFDITHWSRECRYTDDSKAYEVASQAEQNAKDYSDSQISGVNTSISNINNMFSDGVLLPNEKRNIEYKIYSMFGLPHTTYSQNTLLLKQGSGTNAGISIVSENSNTSTLRSFVSWIKSCEADCDFVNTIKLLDAYFPSDDPYESSGIYGSTFNVDLQVIELRNQLNNFLTIFQPNDSYGCQFNKIVANLELFNGKSTKLTDPTEFLSWCEIFERSLNIIKFTFLEYRLSKAEQRLSAL